MTTLLIPKYMVFFSDMIYGKLCGHKSQSIATAEGLLKSST